MIRANAEILSDGALDDAEAAPMFLDAIVRHADRMSAMVSDLLDLSKIESGNYPVERKATDVKLTIARTVDTVSQSASDKSISVVNDCRESLWALADESALEHVLTNLLDNAIKYVGEGGSVRVRARQEGEHVTMEVEDNGPGIDRKHWPRLFERFYRIDKGRSRAQGGTGLGLAIVKHLVGLLGGEVGYRPKEGGGSVFWFTLPVAP